VVLLLRSVSPDAVDERAKATPALGTVVPAEETRELAGAVGVEVALQRLQQFVHDIRRPRVSVLPGGRAGIVKWVLGFRRTVQFLHPMVLLLLAVISLLSVVLGVVMVAMP